jgi:acetyl-CoA acetyltransferase
VTDLEQRILARAMVATIEAEGIERATAVKIATAIAEVIRGTVVTTTDLQASEARLMARLDQIERRIPRGD